MMTRDCLKVKKNRSTSFLHHQCPHVPPAEDERRLTAETLQQVLSSVLQVERALVLQMKKQTIPHFFINVLCLSPDWFFSGTAAATDLYSEDENSASGHHVEEEDHGFILVRRVGVKYPLGHDVTLRHTRQQTVTESSQLSD